MYPTNRILTASAATATGEAIEIFWPLQQSSRLRRSFGTTSLPLKWRSTSFGNQSGILWRGYTSFNVTYLLLKLFFSFSIVSLMLFLLGIQKMPWHERACACRFSRPYTVMHGHHGHARSWHGHTQPLCEVAVLSICSLCTVIIYKRPTGRCMRINCEAYPLI